MNTLQEKLISDVSIDEMWTHLEKLCEWDRTTGTEGEFAAVDYVRSVLESYGLPVTMHEYRAYISHPISGGLTVDIDGEHIAIDAKTRAFSANTPEQGLSGELVSIKGGKNMTASWFDRFRPKSSNWPMAMRSSLRSSICSSPITGSIAD